jgi:hypothetical protein
MSTQRTITLTGRPPVRIVTARWPIIAHADDLEHDGAVESQAFRTSRWSIRVRQHADGRAIVYAVYTYHTRWEHERCHTARHGVLMADATPDMICRAVRDVCADMASADCDGDDAARWPALAAECIGSLPAEVLL